jgi:hypothetical protein
MASEHRRQDDDNEGGLHQVVSDVGGGLEFGGAVDVNTPIQVEHPSAIRADIPTQIEFLATIATALRELRPYVTDTALLDKTAADADELQSELTPPDVVNKWLLLLGAISLLFLKHFAATAGDDLGHAVANKIIQVLSQLLNEKAVRAEVPRRWSRPFRDGAAAHGATAISISSVRADEGENGGRAADRGSDERKGESELLHRHFRFSSDHYTGPRPRDQLRRTQRPRLRAVRGPVRRLPRTSS